MIAQAESSSDPRMIHMCQVVVTTRDIVFVNDDIEESLFEGVGEEVVKKIDDVVIKAGTVLVQQFDSPNNYISIDTDRESDQPLLMVSVLRDGWVTFGTVVHYKTVSMEEFQDTFFCTHLVHFSQTHRFVEAMGDLRDQAQESAEIAQRESVKAQTALITMKHYLNLTHIAKV